MQFFSIYDLILSRTKEMGLTLEEMFLFFRKRHIKKADLIGLSQTAYIPDTQQLKAAIFEYLGMSELEIELSMGHVPTAYRESYFSKIRDIAALLKEKTVDSPKILTPYYENEYGRLYNDDCLEVLRNLPNECVDLVFADPPFNLGKTYDPGIDDNLTMSHYVNWMYEWLDECVRILKPGGRIFIYNIPKWCVYIASHLAESMTFWAWIVVDMKFSLPIQNRLYPAHYGLVSFIKGTSANTFVNPRIPLQTCRHCGGEIKDYGGYKNKMNPQGVNVSDVWTDIYPVRHKSSKNRKYNELSVKLLDRIISMSTNEGDVIFDPFGGSGTTYAVAQILNRKWIGCELGDCEVIKNRLINKDKDVEQLRKVREESGSLFPNKVKELRLQNGFWVCEDFLDTDDSEPQYGQLSLDLKTSITE